MARLYGRCGLKTMRANLQPFWAAEAAGMTEIMDENGYATGAYKMSYSEPAYYEGNISADQGQNAFSPFGINESYSRVLLMEGRDCPLSETSVLWIDDLDTSKPHNHIVRGVARSLETSKFALQKVEIPSGASAGGKGS